MAAPELVTLAVGAVIAAMAVFSLSILAGLRLLKWLGVEPELPEGLAWEQPAPPSRAPGDRQASAASRAWRDRMAAIRDGSRECWLAGRACQELADRADPSRHAAERAVIDQAAEACARQLELATQAMQLSDPDAAERAMAAPRAACAEALARARAAAASLPDPEAARNRRLVVWMTLAAILGSLLLLLQRR